MTHPQRRPLQMADLIKQRDLLEAKECDTRIYLAKIQLELRLILEQIRDLADPSSLTFDVV